MAAADYALNLEAHATYRLELTVKQGAAPNAPAFHLAGWTPRMQIRPSAESVDVILDCTAASGRLTVADAAQGKLLLLIPVGDTSRMDFETAVYDLVISNGTEVRRLLKGAVQVSKGVTR